MLSNNWAGLVMAKNDMTTSVPFSRTDAYKRSELRDHHAFAMGGVELKPFRPRGARLGRAEPRG